MQIFQTELPFSNDCLRTLAYLLPGAPENVCFFDIETTGLSPNISNVYLIGAARRVFDKITLTQWFADDYNSEASLLGAFSEYLDDCSHVVHYNGSTFDIPYLEKKYVMHGLSSPFAFRSTDKILTETDEPTQPEMFDIENPASDLSIALESIDIYRRIAACKRMFPVQNNKLVTMEQLIGFNRGTDFSGKDCIQLYSEYIQKKYAHLDAEKDSLLKSILKHNRDDLIGTIRCAAFLYYTDYRPSSPVMEIKDRQVVFTDKLPEGYSFPIAISYDNPVSKSGKPFGKKYLPDSKPAGDFSSLDPVVHIKFCKNTLTVTVPLLRDTLYHYFTEYKDYYYLPDEDMAIHKSVGSFVDRHRREQATAANCYSRKDGTFLPLPPRIYPERTPVFYRRGWTRSTAFIDINNTSELYDENKSENNIGMYMRDYLY